MTEDTTGGKRPDGCAPHARRSRASGHGAGSHRDRHAVWAPVEAQTYLDLAGVMFLALDEAGRVSMINRKGCEILRATEENVIGRDWVDTFVPEARREAVRRTLQGIMSGQIQLYEHAQNEVLTATGEQRVVEWHNSVIRDESGRIIGTLSSGVDVTERRRAEELQQVMQQIATAVHTSSTTGELFRTIHRELGRVINTENFFIALYDKASDTISLNYFVDQEDQEDFKSFPAGKTLSAYVIKHNMPLLLTREQMDRWVEAGLVDMVGTPSLVWLGVPLRVSGEVTGVIVVQSYTDKDEFGLTDLEMLEFVSSQVGLAIERKRTEEQLRDSEARNRAILDAVPDVMFQFTGDGVFVSCDAPNGAPLALSPDDFLGRHISDVFPEAFARNVMWQIRRTLETGEMQLFEYQIPVPMPEGELRDFEARLVPAGENVLAVVRDITEHKRADRLLEALNGAALAMEQTQTPEEVFASASAALAPIGLTCLVLLADEDGEHLRIAHVGRETGVTDVVERVAGLRLHGSKLRIATCASYSGPVHLREPVFSADLTGIASALVSEHASPDLRALATVPGLGQCIHAPLTSGESVLGVLSVHSDHLTPKDVPAIYAFANLVAAAVRRTSLMQKLRHSVEELELTHDELLQAQKMEAVGRLAGGVAHDFNNLLTAIAGYAELLLSQPTLDPQVRADVGEIRKASDQAGALTRQLLAFSRRQPLEPRSLDINATVSGLRSMLGRLVGEDVAIATELDPHAGCARADAGQIEQVIANMVVNARDAMPDGGKITVRTESVVVGEAEAKTTRGARPGGFVRLSIEDTGCGMTEDVLEHIFEPFFTTKAKGKGTGLGLSVVYGIVSQHEGWIEVNSELGLGTAFRIYIPASGEQPAEPVAAPAVSASAHGHGERILLVEDEDAVREFATRALREGGYTVYEANGADQAMAVFDDERGDFSVVFSDVVLPDRSGIGLVGDLLAKKPELQVLLASGYTDQKSQWLVIREKGFRFLQKPYSLPDLLSALREVTGARD